MHKRDILRIDLNLLRVFDAIYMHRHLTRAGEKMFMTQPAMSHALRRLRAVFKDELFVRTPRGMVPTACAEGLAPIISSGLHELQAVLELSTTFDPETAQREFCIAVEEYGALMIVARLIETIRPIATGITIRTIDVASTPRQGRDGERAIYGFLDTGEIDLAIVFAQDHPPRFRQEILYSDPAVCVVSATNDLVGDRLDLETYLKLGHIKVILESEDRPTVVDYALAKLGRQRKVFMTLPHLVAALSAVASSDLIATVPLQVTKSLGAVAKLRFLKPPFEVQANVVTSLWHRRWHDAPASIWLRQMVMASCASL